MKLQITDHIELIHITLNDAEKLRLLMHQIYTPVYKHLWEDKGNWYVEKTFGIPSLSKELSEVKAPYFFVDFQGETIGILRIIYDAPLPEQQELKATKLHRIYLNPTVHGKGIGLQLMDWSAQQASINGSEIIWLEAMDTQLEALNFYKNLGYQIKGDFRLTFEKMHTHLKGMHRMSKTLS